MHLEMLQAMAELPMTRNSCECAFLEKRLNVNVLCFRSKSVIGYPRLAYAFKMHSL